jgi:hypothetical protein
MIRVSGRAFADVYGVRLVNEVMCYGPGVADAGANEQGQDKYGLFHG